jgi:cation diffusion facilitator CzcD-associated flavoprotein CzcO
MQFRSEITKCVWDESSSTWAVHGVVTRVDGNGQETKEEFVEESDILLHATGVLNNFKWPAIKGIETFKGKLIHTARWPEEYQSEAWKQDRVAVIGSGASSIQTVPTMQPHVKHMDVFVRTPVWFVEIAGNQGKNHPYTPEQQEEFRKHPEKLVEHAKALEDQVNGVWGVVLKDTPEQKMAQEYFRERTKGIFAKKPELAEKIIPKWSIGCRRITPGDPYMNAIQEENVDVHFTEVVEINETGLVGKDGTQVKDVDTIVCATGKP